MSNRPTKPALKGEFSVYQFFCDGSQERVVSFVDAQTAVDTAVGLTRSVGGQLGTTNRIIITDGGDFSAWEWEHGKGIVFPPELASKGQTESSEKVTDK